jgi:hypothetical protein
MLKEGRQVIPERNVPDFLKWSPAKEAEFRETQRKLYAAAARRRARLSPVEQAFVGGMRREVALRQNLAALAGAAELTAPQKDLALRLRASLSEALAAQGRYAEAADFCADPARLKELVALERAVWRSDSDECKCAHVSDPRGANGAEVRLLKYHVEAHVFSPKHGREMAVVRCNGCGHRNVRALPPDLQEQIHAQEQIRQMTRGLSREEARARLASNNLTDRHLLRRR